MEGLGLEDPMEVEAAGFVNPDEMSEPLRTPPPTESGGNLDPTTQTQLDRLLTTVRQLAEELEKTKEELRSARRPSTPHAGQLADSQLVGSLDAIATSLQAQRKNVWEKDLPKLAKLVKITRFEPRSEQEYEDTLYDWECKAKGSGMKEEVLKHLMMHLGSEKVLHVLESIDVPNMSWMSVKNAAALKLFPYSRYRPELEREMTSVDRSRPVEEALLLLAKQRKRYDQLCERWGKGNAMSDDRLKEALLSKLPAHRVTACIATEKYNGMTFDEFGHHCEMIISSVLVGEKAMGVNAKEGKRAVTVKAVDVAHIPRPTPPPSTQPPKKPAPPDYVCYNCGEEGHYMRTCPHPKARCANCNRTGHRTESCTKLQHAGPLGRTRTGFLRITRGGIHLDLVDEATKRALFESMRTHLEGQEKAYDIAKDKAKKKRDEKRAEELIAGLDTTEPADLLEMGPTATPMETDIEISTAGFLDPMQKTPSHYLDIEMLGVKTPALLDSGAAVSLLPSSLWHEVPSHQKETVVSCSPGHYPIMGLGGALKIEAVIEAPIKVSQAVLMQRFFVCEAPSLPILGMDALNNLGLNIDYGSGNIFIQGENSPLKQSEELGISPLCNQIGECQPTDDGPCFKLGTGCLPAEEEAARKLFLSIPEVWRDPISGTCNTTLHNIDTGDAIPIRSRARRLPPEKVAEVKEQVKTLLASGAIRESNSPWASPIVLVPKANGTTRMCVDYRALNKVTRKDAFPLPRITEMLDRLAQARVFTTLDLAAGFHQIPLDEASIPKTAFITPDGLYEYKVLPFGLANAPSTFQRMTDAIFRDPPLCNNVAVYIDDIVVYTPTVDNHLELLKQTLLRLKEVRLFVNLAKTTVFARKAKYLGFIIEDGYASPDPKQIAALTDLRPPVDVQGVRRFLGLAGYFRHFIPQFSLKAIPLTSLLKKNTQFSWTSETQKAWEGLKEELAGSNVRLTLPVNGHLFILDTDASNHALGAVLQQQIGEHLRPIAYASRTLTPAEKNWTTREQEAYAIVWGVLHFAPYLRVQPHFVIRSDHQSLRWLWKAENKRIIRWALLLQEFNFTIEHNKGQAHQHVDIFSRDSGPDPAADAQVERIATKSNVFAADVEEPPLHKIPPFPTFDEMMKAQKDECDESTVTRHHLRMGHQGLYQPPQGTQIYVPTALRRSIMYYFHYGSMGAHQGVNKSFSRIRRLFWWPGLKDSIQDYNNHCLTCARRRPQPTTKSRGHLLASGLGDVVAMDVIGPIATKEGPISLLTVVDHFTRYAHATILTEITSETVWNALYRDWISVLGTPTYILSDNATVFTSKKLKVQFEEFGVQSLHSFPYHPEGNGIVESFHLFLKGALVANLRLTEWSVQQVLSTILMAYRSTPNVATGETPYFLLTGVDMSLPKMQEWTNKPVSVQENVTRLTMLDILRKEAFDYTARRAVERETSKKRGKDEQELQPGTLVLRWMTHAEKLRMGKQMGSHKLEPLWSQPYRIVRQLANRKNTYVIRRIGYRNSKASIAPRESLIAIPGNYEAEEATQALGELIADFKRPKVTKTTSSASTTDRVRWQGEDEHFEDIFQDLISGSSQMPPTSPQPSTSQGQFNSTTVDARKDQAKKRLRTAHCVSWVDMHQLIEDISTH